MTVKKVEVPKQNLAAQYSTNKVGMGVKKTINFNAGKVRASLTGTAPC